SALDLAADGVVLGVVEDSDSPMVAASFHLEVGDLLSTTLMQLMPVEFAKELIEGLMTQAPPAPAPAAPAEPAPRPPPRRGGRRERGTPTRARNRTNTPRPPSASI
ncbi:MAG: hypothetical protein KDC33_12840, partial [Thermoleophilia bacterium]|nr:hypothetical protein [Thermoleophilia bacterium]